MSTRKRLPAYRPRTAPIRGVYRTMLQCPRVADSEGGGEHDDAGAFALAHNSSCRRDTRMGVVLDMQC